MREALPALVSQKGPLLEPEAVDYLLSHQDPLGRLERLFATIRPAPLVVTLRDVLTAEGIAPRAAAPLRAPLRGRAPTPPPGPAAPGAASFRRTPADAADHAPDIKVLRDITGQSTCEGTIEDFTRYFRHRFQTLGSMLRSRRQLRIVGMVSEVRTTKNGHRILDIEDEVDRASVLLPADSPLASEVVVSDEVLGVVGTVNDRGLLIAQSLVRPDIPVSRAFRGASDHIP